jgi:hypothetical protein
LEKKRAKQDAQSKKCWFFRTVSSDPTYAAQVDFVERLIGAIEAIEETNNHDNRRAFRHLVRSGLNGKEGFAFLPTEITSSVLYGLLICKDHAIGEERALRSQQYSQKRL